MTWRGYNPGPSDPGVEHQKLLPVAAWPAGDRIPLSLQGGIAVLPRWRYLVFETDGTVLIEDESGMVLPYTRPAGSVLPFSGVAIVKAYAHGIVGQPTETSADLVLYGHR